MIKSYKKIVLVVALSMPLLSFSPTSQAADACEIVLCMYGKMVGKSQSECRSAEREYFSIIAKKKGKFNASRTATARLKQLNKCPSPENNAINSTFGRMRTGF